MYKDYSINEFIEKLESEQPTPGGGGASALCGVIGTALGSMVGNLTFENKKYIDVREDIQELLEKLNIKKMELLELIDKDEEAFLPLTKAYKLSKSNEEEKEYRQKVMENALYNAAIAPLTIMEKIYEVILIEEEISKKGTKMAISDIAVGMQILKASLLGASANVFINTKLMQNRKIAEELNFKVNDLISKSTILADRVFNEIIEKIRK